MAVVGRVRAGSGGRGRRGKEAARSELVGERGTSRMCEDGSCHGRESIVCQLRKPCSAATFGVNRWHGASVSSGIPE